MTGLPRLMRLSRLTRLRRLMRLTRLTHLAGKLSRVIGRDVLDDEVDGVADDALLRALLHLELLPEDVSKS